MAKFNTYIEHPEIGRWRDLCVNEGELCEYAKGEEFVSIGTVARYIGYVKSGTLKYVIYDELEIHDMAPTVNCRIESVNFTINSEDKNLIL